MAIEPEPRESSTRVAQPPPLPPRATINSLPALPQQPRHSTLLLVTETPLLRTQFEAAVAAAADFTLAGTCRVRDTVAAHERLRPDIVIVDGAVESNREWPGAAVRLQELEYPPMITLVIDRDTEPSPLADRVDAVLSVKLGIAAVLEALRVLKLGAVVSVGPQSPICAVDMTASDLAEQLSTLTRREREILTLIADGLSNRQVSDRLFISPNTVKEYVSRILGKLGVTSRIEAAVLAVQAEIHGIAETR
ncbi:response regulator transcription factor [Nocardia sp. NPDC058519]|uniref:response regulator transcription factor n=1 Tax=Nocardia sp. NPDC058519 TaxID=3346535 RepID=UPI003647EE8F